LTGPRHADPGRSRSCELNPLSIDATLQRGWTLQPEIHDPGRVLYGALRLFAVTWVRCAARRTQLRDADTGRSLERLRATRQRSPGEQAQETQQSIRGPRCIAIKPSSLSRETVGWVIGYTGPAYLDDKPTDRFIAEAVSQRELGGGRSVHFGDFRDPGLQYMEVRRRIVDALTRAYSRLDQQVRDIPITMLIAGIQLEATIGTFSSSSRCKLACSHYAQTNPSGTSRATTGN